MSLLTYDDARLTPVCAPAPPVHLDHDDHLGDVSDDVLEALLAAADVLELVGEEEVELARSTATPSCLA